MRIKRKARVAENIGQSEAAAKRPKTSTERSRENRARRRAMAQSPEANTGDLGALSSIPEGGHVSRQESVHFMRQDSDSRNELGVLRNNAANFDGGTECTRNAAYEYRWKRATQRFKTYVPSQRVRA
jgi:hypothetical protein